MLLSSRSLPLLQRLRRLASPARSVGHLARPPSWVPLLHPAVPFVAFGAGVWLALDSERPGRVHASAVSSAGAAARAVRLAGCGTAMAIDYARVRRSQTQQGASDDADTADATQLTELQKLAGRVELQRGDAVRQGEWTQMLEDEARRTRNEAAAFGEAVVARRLERERRSGAAVVWRDAHARNAVRLLQLCVTNGGLYVKLGQHLAQLDYLVPQQYTHTLSVLFERNRSSSYADVRPTRKLRHTQQRDLPSLSLSPTVAGTDTARPGGLQTPDPRPDPGVLTEELLLLLLLLPPLPALTPHTNARCAA